MTTLPTNLAWLVQRYDGQSQQPVSFITGSWLRALAAWPDEATVLGDARWTHVSDRAARRQVDRSDLVRLLGSTDLDDGLAVRRAFVLVMAWGSGTSNTRSYRNVPTALAAADCADQLVHAARRCRASDLEQAFDMFTLAGVGRSFFTKWFAFAGRVPDGDWQPLILDRRGSANVKPYAERFDEDDGGQPPLGAALSGVCGARACVEPRTIGRGNPVLS